jgi:hypothetical protein
MGDTLIDEVDDCSNTKGTVRARPWRCSHGSQPPNGSKGITGSSPYDSYYIEPDMESLVDSMVNSIVFVCYNRHFNYQCIP